MPFDEPKKGKDLQWDSKVFKATPRLYPRNSGFKGITSSRDHRTQVIAVRLSWIHSRGIGYLHSCSRLKCTCVLMLLLWCSHDAHGMVQGDAVMQCRQVLVT
jgi:hypothetical protein